MTEVKTAYQLIENEMTTMEELARESLSGVDSFVGEVVRYSIQLSGKRLRPMLLFLAGRAIGNTVLLDNKHVQTAAAIEFVHTASLIHDDILDGASIRRHCATINVRWNVQIGVLAGDLLLTRALELMARNGELHGFRRLAEACRKTCEGELRQLGSVNRFDMTPDEYYEMIAGKTAPLLACSAELGAYYSGADNETTERFRIFGHKLGLAFQIVDDVLDMIGETGTAGKTLRTDLINRKPTLPLILYLKAADSADRTETLNRICRNDFDELSAQEMVLRFCESGAVVLAKQEAERLINEAIALLSGFNGNTQAIAALISVAQFVVNRDN
ncbi:MAG: polyprenyl synthetase family protein [Planctomycetaceae bacterium]|jgi:octaprenyl-diphosphate synthase|nr:polyprenyl synthetase family protein [Planctomycetaceae bacterium]